MNQYLPNMLFSIANYKKTFFTVVMVCLGISVFSQTSGENYIKTTTYKVPTTNSITNPSATQATVEMTYMDGLGRPKQKIAHRQSGNGEDLVTHIEYDGFGRQAKEYLPFERNASLIFDQSAESNTLSFYNDPAYGNTSNPYSQKEFETSALNRVLRQASPGDEWAMNSGHEIKFDYQTNGTGQIHHFSVSLAGSTPTLQYNGHYPAQQLYLSVTKDENYEPSNQGGIVKEYKNKKGQVVLKRTYNTDDGARRDEDSSIIMDTYYVYDVYGNLTFVLPPMLSEQIKSGGSLVGGSQLSTLLDNLGYQYKYDYRNRLIHKKIPGKRKEFIAYDLLDRVVATGPVLSPFGDGEEGWLHTKYDKFNRVVYTFWKARPTITENGRQALTDIPPALSEHRISTVTTVNNVSFAYSNDVSPTSGYHILTVNYYDNYSFPGSPYPIRTSVGEGDISVYYNNTILPKGLATGGWVREVETAAEQKGSNSYTLYDYKARPVRIESSNWYSGYTQTDTKYNFIGNPIYTITKHKKDGTMPEISIREDFTYDDQARLERHTHKIGNQPKQLLSHNEYDALGRLKTKQVGGTDISGANSFQEVDYSYNIRNWLTGINNIYNLAQSGDPLDLFAFKLNYTQVDDDINGAVEPLYNGNIAETYWRTSSDNIKRRYGFAYDQQNRLLDAYYQIPNTSIPVTNSYNEHITYDNNGNILTLERNGEQDTPDTVIPIDNLAYDYYDNSNKLKSVSDHTDLSMGYNDTHTIATEVDFDYDDFGNLILNEDKDIETITYNHLNLPIEITFGSGATIEYIYDAMGIKLKKEVTQGTNSTVTEYRDGFQYTKGDLDFFPTAEGYVKVMENTGGNLEYYYVFNYTDHLGNIRVRYAEDPQTGELAILEENHYYPYGLKHNGYNGNHQVFDFTGIDGNIQLTPVNPFLGDSYKYKFGGKEYQDEVGVNGYDFGARNYDPALGRWMNTDPLAEDMRRHSPYNYAFDNPVYFIDPDGMAPTAGYKDYNPTTSTGSVDFYGGFDVTSFDKNGKVLDSQFTTSLDNVTMDSDGNISNGGGGNSGGGGGGLSLTNKRNVGGVAGLSMGADGVESIGGNSGGQSNFSSSENALTIGGLLYGIGENVIASKSSGYWLGINGKYYSVSWGGNGYTGGRSLAFKAASYWKMAGVVTFAVSGLMSAAEGVNHYNNGNYTRASKSGFDIFMGGVGTWGGPPGLLTSGFYFATNSYMDFYTSKLNTNPSFLKKEMKKATKRIPSGFKQIP